jgi:acyl CoA:acetate/3-ketoacid CoA transferase alpha subunit
LSRCPSRNPSILHTSRLRWRKEKRERDFNGKPHIRTCFKADFAFVKLKGDTAGNHFKGTARNFNPVIVRAATITAAEVEELVPAGELDPQPNSYFRNICQAHLFKEQNMSSVLSNERLEQETK